jgi:UDP-N-acetylglucosamine--N-acetylmuramyl-(pentapeptide) pyrophosphoryl-undecaprenol N-acetylglucosamine transferase
VNAAALAAAGAARMIEEKDLSGRALAEAIRQMVAEPQAMARMEGCAKGLGRPDAAARVADLVEPPC